MTRARNGPHGYGWVSKGLHWLTVVVLVAQFAVGWSMSDDAVGSAGEARLSEAEERLERFEEAGEDRAEQQGEVAEEAFEAELERREAALDRLDAAVDAEEDAYVRSAAEDVVTLRFPGGGLSGAEAHVLLGLTVLALGLARLGWRRWTPLPPWAEHLSEGERRLEAWLEKAMLTLLLAVPSTGLLLVLGSDDLLPVHVAAQVALLAVVAVHVGLVLSHTVVRRHRHLARML